MTVTNRKNGESIVSMIQEFKDFAMKGNVVDMAVGIVIGGGFGKIVAAFVADIVTPVVGVFSSGQDLSEMNVVLKEAMTQVDGTVVEAVTLNYGHFFQTVIDFTIVAFSIFIVIKAMNNARKKEEEAPAAPPEPSKEEVLLTEIRDAIKAN